MTYSAKSNPNATNSELDSKRIITHKELTSLQRDELISQYCEIFVDRMSVKDLELYVIDDVFNILRDKNEIDLKKWIGDEELYDELVDNVTNETVLDTNNNGGKF